MAGYDAVLPGGEGKMTSEELDAIELLAKTTTCLEGANLEGANLRGVKNLILPIGWKLTDQGIAMPDNK
jgi:hypothetical protein